MARVLLLVVGDEDRRILTEHLGRQHDLLAPATLAADVPGTADLVATFDLCLLDSAALARHGERLRALRREARPLFLPVLLLASVEEVEQADPSTWELADDAVVKPYLRPVLDKRIRILLRTRRLSELAHAELRQILDSASVAVCVVDERQAVQRVNRAFACLFGTTPEAMVGRSCEAILGAEVCQRIEAAQACTDGADPAADRQRIAEQEIGITDAAGQATTCLLTAVPFLGLDGERLGTIIELKDVTRLKQDEAQLRQSAQRLEAALAELQAMQNRVVRQERLHALGEMASGIAHDFRNALSIILGYSEMLLGDADGDALGEATRRGLAKVVTAARDASAAVERLRSFYRQRDEGEPFWPVALDRVVEETVELTRGHWQDRARARGAEIRLERQLGQPPRVLGSESELREALTNLILNAVDAMPGGGTLAIHTAEEDGAAVLRVRDSGQGMDEEARQRCLEPFFTTKGEQGSGMGLAMVFGAVSRHRGRLEIDSRPGQGTTVTIRLPGMGEQRSALSAASGAPSIARPLRILVVDDQADVRAGLVALLERDGHEVTQAGDGREALARFEAGRLDLVITDRAMPGMSGEQLARAIREQRPEQRVILITGFDDPAVGPPAIGETVDALLHKPVDLAALRRTICEVCA